MRPEVPAELNDRAQDNWEPLLAIADFAGGHWPQTARAAALQLSGVSREEMSVSAELLTDIRDIFEQRGADRMTTADLLAALAGDD
jgi:putative DNA primase/helicase